MTLTLVDYPIKKNPAYVKNTEATDERYVTMLRNGPRGAVLHSIGTPQPSAKVIADYFNSPTVEASVHMVLQPDGLCYRLAPDNFRMWHVGGSANNTHMGIEMTEPKEISYDPQKGYRLTIHNKEAVLSHVEKTYKKAVELFGDLCIRYSWDPLEDGVILSHKECYERGIGSNHGDPEHLWDALSTGFTMDTFRKAVWEEVRKRKEAQTLKEEETQVPTEEAQSPKEEAQVPTGKEEQEMRYETLGQLRKDPKAPDYLPTIEKLIGKGVLLGKGGQGDDRILDLSEDAVRILVFLDRAGLF